MKIRRATIAGAVLAAGALAVPGAALAHGSGSGNGPNAVGLSNSGTNLVRFDTDKPGEARSIGRVAGLSGDRALVGIDRRVQNGKLYGVGNRGGIYVLSSSGRATKVGQLSIALNGTAFGVDFNPAANALRIVSNTGQNLRQPFGTGDAPTAPTVLDGALNYLSVTATGVSAAAYTNNDLNADTATTLFDIDTTLDQVVIQAPANSGSLSPTGRLGVNAVGDAGFDIYSDLRRGKTVSSEGFAVLKVDNKPRLYSVNVLTGEVKSLGKLRYSVSDIAVNLDT